MRILYYFTEYKTPMFQWQRYHIFDELEHHDCYVAVFNPLDYANKDEANEKVVQKMKDHSYDLFLTPHNEEWLYIETIKEIKRTGIPMILILFDSLMTPLRHRNVASFFDLLMLSQKDKQGIFKKYNKNIIVSHYAANPFYFKPTIVEKTVNKICFPGTPYGSRANVINKLTSNNIPIDLYFGGEASQKVSISAQHNSISSSKLKVLATLLRTDVGRKVIAGAVVGRLKGNNQGVNLSSSVIVKHDSVTLAETNQIYSEHDLSLSIATARNTGNLKQPVMIVHLRNFEIPMSGGVQFCEYFPELAECFEDGKEIIFYRTEEEMIEKARYYLDPAHENERARIRIAARKRAETEHTWFQRFSKAFDYLGLQY